jgi:hypothetical protein
MDYFRHKTNAPWILVFALALISFGLATESAPAQRNGDPTQNGQSGTRSFPTVAGYGTADSNGSMIAVTGIDVTGGSILYVIDTERRSLSVYQATGGTSSTMNVKFVGARNIDLDLQVDGYNDKSEYTYRELEKRFTEHR